MVTGSRFGASRLPQNLGSGQRNASTATYWGRGRASVIAGKTISKLLYRPAGILHNNDEPMRTPGDVLGCRGKKMSNADKAPVLNDRKSADQT